MSESREIELVFEPLEEGGHHVYAPDLPGLHTQGDDIEEASRDAEEPGKLLKRREQLATSLRSIANLLRFELMTLLCRRTQDRQSAVA
ncbi:MAG: type II toxin-antitoxin system HicB family antitoxin [Actinobacteria bacterium]|nr:type II toxin-antitoxin system HicB family antitoxin [Actinomycetota bacterium]